MLSVIFNTLLGFTKHVNYIFSILKFKILVEFQKECINIICMHMNFSFLKYKYNLKYSCVYMKESVIK